MHCEENISTTMKFKSDILMNLLFIWNTIFFKVLCRHSGVKAFQLWYYTGVKRHHYGVKGVASKVVIMEESRKNERSSIIGKSVEGQLSNPQLSLNIAMFSTNGSTQSTVLPFFFFFFSIFKFSTLVQVPWHSWFNCLRKPVKLKKIV